MDTKNNDNDQEEIVISALLLKIGLEKTPAYIPLTIYRESAVISTMIKYELLIETLEATKNEFGKDMNIQKYKTENKAFFEANEIIELIIEISDDNQTIFSLYKNDGKCILANFKDHEPLYTQAKIAYEFLKDELKLDENNYKKWLNESITELEEHYKNNDLSMDDKHSKLNMSFSRKVGSNQRLANLDLTSIRFSEVGHSKPRASNPVIDDVSDDDLISSIGEPKIVHSNPKVEYVPEDDEISSFNKPPKAPNHYDITAIDEIKLDTKHVVSKDKNNQILKRFGPMDVDNFREQYAFQDKNLFKVKKYTNHMVYEGMLDSRDIRDGFGQITYEDGSIYEGEWKSDKRDGYGRLIECESNWHVGFWKKDLRDGFGTRLIEDGRRIEGMFVNDKVSGEAQITCPNGSYYKGFFKDNIFISGTGKEIYSSGKEYTGQFVDGKYSGEGTLTYEDGSIYKGNFKNGMGNGQGSLTKKSKVRYEGNFINGFYDGNGEIFFTDGSKYKGLFKNGNREGKGLYTSNNNREFRQLWKDGKQLPYSDCQIF